MIRALYFLIFVLFIVSCKEKDDDLPLEKINSSSISKIYPLEGTVGTEIRIEGENFIPDTSKTQVEVEGVRSIIKEIQENYIITYIPAASKDLLAITLISSGKRVGYVEKFKVLSPIINDFSPKSGFDTLLVTIKGKNFGSIKDKVTVNLVGATSSESQSECCEFEITELSDSIIIGKVGTNWMASMTDAYIQVNTGAYKVKSTQKFHRSKTYHIPNKTSSPLGVIQLNDYNPPFTHLNIKIGGINTFIRGTWGQDTYEEWYLVCPELAPGKYKVDFTDEQNLPVVPIDGIDSISVVDAQFSFSPSNPTRGSKVSINLPYASLQYCEIGWVNCVDNHPILKLVNASTSEEFEFKLTKGDQLNLLDFWFEFQIPETLATGAYQISLHSPNKIYEYKSKEINLIQIQ